MSVKKSQEYAAPDPSNQKDEAAPLPGSGAGAASALERLRAERALRHRRQHGGRTAGPGHEEDPDLQR